jgi:hypothetical protein
MASTSNKPVDSHDSGPQERKTEVERPNRKDAADRDILPGAEAEAETTDPTEVAEATGDPDSIEAFKKVQEEAAAAEKAAKESEEA